MMMMMMMTMMPWNFYKKNFCTRDMLLNIQLLNDINHHHHHQGILPKDRSFTANPGVKAAVLFNGRSSTADSGTQAAVLLGIIGAVTSRCSPHPTLSLAYEQTLKDPRGTSVEMRRVDLANWALRTSPKFTTGVKYQFHQGFWPDQRSGNPNYPSPPIHE